MTDTNKTQAGERTQINPLLQHPDGSPKWENPTTVIQRGDSYGIPYERTETAAERDKLREQCRAIAERAAQDSKVIDGLETWNTKLREQVKELLAALQSIDNLCANYGESFDLFDLESFADVVRAYSSAAIAKAEGGER